MVEAVLLKHNLPEDVAMQVAEMVRESTDSAIRQLTSNGGGIPVEAQGYLHAARTAEEIKLVMASDTAVPKRQIANTDGMDDDLAAIVNKVQVHGEPQKLDIILPEEGPNGQWAF